MNTLGNLPIGAKFADKGRSNLILRVAGRDLDGYPGTIGVADDIVRFGCFDAREPGNPDRRRALYGNNNYPTCCARQWLTADGKGWYKPAHEYDAPPIADNVFDGDHPYADAPGFLTDFSDGFKAAMIKAHIKTRNANTGEIEVVNDPVWLLSSTEIGFDENGGEGVFFPIFEEFRMKIATFDQSAVDVPDSLKSKSWYYWLRSPYAAFSYGVRIVSSDGAEYNSLAHLGHIGLRPALLLKSDILASNELDDYGVYYVVG